MSWADGLLEIQSKGSTTAKAASLAGLHEARQAHQSQFFTTLPLSHFCWRLVEPLMERLASRDRILAGESAKISVLDNSVGSGRLLHWATPDIHSLYGVVAVSAPKDGGYGPCFSIVRGGEHRDNPSSAQCDHAVRTPRLLYRHGLRRRNHRTRSNALESTWPRDPDRPAADVVSRPCCCCGVVDDVPRYACQCRAAERSCSAGGGIRAEGRSTGTGYGAHAGPSPTTVWGAEDRREIVASVANERADPASVLFRLRGGLPGKRQRWADALRQRHE